jgi:hypothetical protein
MAIGSIQPNSHYQLTREINRMNNYSIEELVQLRDQSLKFHHLMSSAAGWTKDNLSLEEKELMLNSILETKSEIKTIEESVETKPVFALFGVSQVGKSYLVKNLLSSGEKNLEINLPNENIDFLQSINPRGGGTESTGVVSRFTIDANIIHNDFPIKVKLLDTKDVLLIICDSFFSDIIKLESYPSSETIETHLDNFKKSVANSTYEQTFLNEDHIYYLKKYFENYLERANPKAVEFSKSEFWPVIADVISKIEPIRWVELFEIIWGGDKNFSELFRRVLNALAVLNYETTVYVNKSAIHRDEGKILDVMRVEGILDREELITILLPNKQQITIDVHLLSALTAEISMPLSPEVAKEKPFLNYTDLLDFPGARSRKPFEQSDLKRSTIPSLFLRGKVSYLFNKYSSNYEINNLLFCLFNRNNEVKEIPLLINDWIKRNVGENAEEREKRIGNSGTNPLFVVLTFYNETLKFNANSDQGELGEKWEKRFIRLFKEETVTKANDWDDNWTISQQKFNSFYMLRDFQFSEDIFAGYNSNGKELNIHADKLEYYQRLEESFLKFPYVREHFKNPKEAWDESSSPNKDGSQRILNDLYPAANNQIKTKNYTSKLSNFQKKTLDKLKVHYKTDDIQNQRKKAVEDGKKIASQLLNLFTSSGSKFGEFLSKLYISNTETYNFIHENYLPASNDHTPTREEVIIRTFDLDLTKSVEENERMLIEKQNLQSQSDLKKWLEEQNIDLSEVLKNVHITAASTLVDGVLEIWKSKLDTQNFKEYANQGLDLSAVKTITENLIQTFEIFGVRQELIHLFEKKTRLMRVSNDTDEYLASIITFYINDFVSNFGFNFMTDERNELVLELASSYKIDTTALLTRSKNINDQELINLFEEDSSSNILPVTFPVVDHYKNFITKVQLILLSNCGFRKYNVEENNKLKEIIDNLGSLKFA